MKRYLPEGVRYDTEEMTAKLSSEKSIYDAYTEGDYLEAKAVLCDGGHNLHFNLGGGIRGYMPHDECAEGVADGTVRDIAVITRVNKPTGFIIKGFKNGISGEKIAILSRTEYQKECRKNYIDKLCAGDIIDARVSHIEPFGAFCDIGAGITALLPIDGISVSRIPNPSARFSAGDDIKAVIKSVDENGRITLSHKELLGTWEENAAMFNAGETVTGVIRSVEQYGVFVELMPNLAGLAESSEIAKPGDTASIFIKSINPERMKIKLIIVDCASPEKERKPIKYFIDSGHIDSWRYSPEGADKIIISEF